MMPLFVLLSAFTISSVIIRVFQKAFFLRLSARIAMAVMLLFTATGHFIYSKGMTMMLPDFIPMKEQVVWFTGIAELLFAAGLLMPGYYRKTGWALMAFLIIILPANIYAAIHQIDYQQSLTNGYGSGYLLFRIPLQLFFIFWIYTSTVKSTSRSAISGQHQTLYTKERFTIAGKKNAKDIKDSLKT
ncbi:MAG TPA: hypothetical protein VGN63_05850 [Flavisolibacter sp.]|jgi:uncharacterized membrane protein|nr:hypothetical protein [Flavisolibacter sp.]